MAFERQRGCRWPCFDTDILLFFCKSRCSNAKKMHFHDKSWEVCIKARSLPPSLPFKGQVTEQRNVKWSIPKFSPLDIILWVWHSVATLRLNLNTIEYFHCYISIRRECSWQLRLLLNRKSLQRKFLLYFPDMGLHCKFKFHSSTKKYYLSNRKCFPWLHSLI